jgi:osmotically-inducible protein OsmY
MQTTSDQIESEVRAALADDPRVPYADEIAVEVHGDGVAVLRGTVGSFAQERAAVADAKRTRGVADLFDELQVRVLDRDRREDAEIRGTALQRLMADPELEPDHVEIAVGDGWITLTGDVGHQYQSDRAFELVAGLTGVTGVTNEIKVVEHTRIPMSDQSREQAVMAALADNAVVRPDEIAVRATGEYVTLRGTVGSLVQREEAVHTAGNVPGVLGVKDELRVRPLGYHRHVDADTEAAVLAALIDDDEVPSAGIEVDVDGDAVTLRGEVEEPGQRERAERVARGVGGVAHVDNELRVRA